jgi:DNA/RNA-binding domain of Phe-tRNA-synthetase-like protein
MPTAPFRRFQQAIRRSLSVPLSVHTRGMSATNIELEVSSGVRELYPDLAIGIVHAAGINNTAKSDILHAELQARAEAVRTQLTTDNLLEVPQIAMWREAYRLFGAKPKESRPTAEAILRRVLQGSQVPRISDCVDAYLATELRYMLPIGGYDLDTVNGAICLVRAAGGEEFHPLGSSVQETVKPGEVIYRDRARVLTRKWNFRDCEECKITTSSTNVALFTELPFAGVSEQILIDSTADMERLIRQVCGGTVTRAIWRAATGQCEAL